MLLKNIARCKSNLCIKNYFEHTHTCDIADMQIEKQAAWKFRVL